MIGSEALPWQFWRGLVAAHQATKVGSETASASEAASKFIGTRTGTEAMACRTVSFVGPSEPLQVSAGGDAVCGCDPHPAASTISRIVTS